MNKFTFRLISSITIALNGIITFSSLWEWYKIKIQKHTGGYPFGTEGPVPYYYSTADMYANMNLVWAVVFFVLFSVCIFTISTGKKTATLIVFGVTVLAILSLMVNGQIESQAEQNPRHENPGYLFTGNTGDSVRVDTLKPTDRSFQYVDSVYHDKVAR